MSGGEACAMRIQRSRTRVRHAHLFAPALPTIVDMTTRYRCGSCGNVTRFDVVATRRTRAFHHYSIGGDLEIEEEEVLDAHVEQVTCRWCGATGDAIEALSGGEPAGELPEQLHDQPS
jgi:hypothetical protein